MKILKKIAIFLLVVLFAIQFIRPEKNLSESSYTEVFEQETNPPEEVMAILKSSCYDCHSSNTKYPWYNNIAPVSFWIADHIEHGKGHLDFSNWDSYDAKKKDHKLEELIETIESGEMPLREYTWTHSEARLTDAQRAAVIEWAEVTRLLYQLGRKPQ
ncbi:MAG: heme-binding domain-containing protein [Flavobacteriaceae bacterium]